ncbi:DUF2180 family protein [Streptomyces cinereospinus]|uniref:DUF2180 family protein n=1 Tax=Streptomyces cinereospinus TaxID=285561 RepID=A0ABV5N0L9_9ACTN
MMCYDCTEEGRTDTVGIGICARCGLFTCRDHAQIVREQVEQFTGLARPAGRPSVRRAVCTTCRVAETTH